MHFNATVNVAGATIAYGDKLCNYNFMKEKFDEKKISHEAEKRRLSSCGWYLGVLGKWMNTKMGETLQPLGISLSQFTIIMTLLEKDGLTQVDIGQKVMLPAYTTSRDLDKLEALGYVRREKHESSRRSHRISLTIVGRNLAPDLFKAAESINDLFLSPLQKDQKAELLKLLKILVNDRFLS